MQVKIDGAGLGGGVEGMERGRKEEGSGSAGSSSRSPERDEDPRGEPLWLFLGQEQENSKAFVASWGKYEVHSAYPHLTQGSCHILKQQRNNGPSST